MKNLTEKMRDELFKMCDRFYRENNHEPTVSELRKFRGSGSYSDICAGLKQWKESRRGNDDIEITMPPEMQTKLEDTAKIMWITASSIATENIKQIQEKYHEEINCLETDMEDALCEISRLESVEICKNNEIKILKEKIETLNVEKVSLEQRNNLLKEDIVSSQSELNIANQEIGELKTKLSDKSN